MYINLYDYMVTDDIGLLRYNFIYLILMAIFNQNTMLSQFPGYIKTMKFLLNAMFLQIQYVQNASHFTLNMRCNEKIININVQKN